MDDGNEGEVEPRKTHKAILRLRCPRCKQSGIVLHFMKWYEPGRSLPLSSVWNETSSCNKCGYELTQTEMVKLQQQAMRFGIKRYGSG